MRACVVCDDRGCEYCPKLDPNGDFPPRDRVEDVSEPRYVLHLTFGGNRDTLMAAAVIATKSPDFLGYKIEEVV